MFAEQNGSRTEWLGDQKSKKNLRSERDKWCWPGQSVAKRSTENEIHDYRRTPVLCDDYGPMRCDAIR